MTLKRFMNIVFVLGIILLIVPFINLLIFKNDIENYNDLLPIQLVQKVVANEDLRAFIILLEKNGIPVPKGDFSFGKINPSLVDYEQNCVNRPRKVYSDGNEFYIVIIKQVGYHDGIHIQHQRVFVFNENGKCIHDSDELVESGKSPSNDIFVLTLGSENFWFIFESTTSTEHRLPKKLHIFLISSTIPKLLVMDMQINSLSYTVTPDHAKIDGVKLSFKPSDPKSFFVDKDGKKIKPTFRWCENKRCFYGHKEAYVDDHLWFRVDMEKSLQFTDIQSKIP
jgi:hypothetical protein